jgi:putative FmdB family regulatory protein
MPRYEYQCPECQWADEVVRPSAERDKPWTCRQCGSLMERQWSNFNTPSDSYHRELHSDALAIVPGQAAEHRQRYPDVALDEACRPVFKNFKQHDNYLEKRGINKPSQRKEIY